MAMLRQMLFEVRASKGYEDVYTGLHGTQASEADRSYVLSVMPLGEAKKIVSERTASNPGDSKNSPLIKTNIS